LELPFGKSGWKQKKGKHKSGTGAMVFPSAGSVFKRWFYFESDFIKGFGKKASPGSASIPLSSWKDLVGEIGKL